MSLNKEKTEKIFAEEFARLNEQQQKAVSTLEGPVMVIAGPGTGKTQILASRIGKILLETDAQPENILCLTYTDAGVVAMRKRLLQFIGPDAYKVNPILFTLFAMISSRKIYPSLRKQHWILCPNWKKYSSSKT